MAADLDTRLRDAAVPPAAEPLDLDAVLARGATLRRRRIAVTTASSLAAVVTLGLLVGQVLPTSPTVQVVGVDEDAAATALVAPVPFAADATGLAQRVRIDPAAVPEDLPGEGRLFDGAVLAVAADGAAVVAPDVDGDGVWDVPRVVTASGDVDTAMRPAGVWWTAVFLPDGGVLGVHEVVDGRGVVEVVAPDGTQRVAEVVDGVVDDRVLLELDDDGVSLVVGGTDGVRIAATVWRPGAGLVEEPVWRSYGPVDDRGGRDPWVTDLESTETGARLTVDGVSFDVDLGRIGGPTSWNELSGSVEGLRVMSAEWVADRGEGRTVTVGLVVGPGRGQAVAVPLAQATPLLDGYGSAGLLVSPDGAVWARRSFLDGGTELLRLVPRAALPAPRPTTPASTVGRATGTANGVAVAAPGGEAARPGGTAPAGPRVPGPCGGDDDCPAGRPVAVAPDGTMAVLVGGGWLGGHELVVGGPREDGTPVHLGDVWQPHDPGDDGAPRLPVAFDEAGDLWALVDRWWIGPRTPDLVVRREGEGSFTSVGRVPLRDLVGVDARSVALHVQGDEVAVVAIGEGGVGRRAVLARDGVATTPQERAASVALLPGLVVPADGASARPVAVVGRDGAVGGPFSGPVGPVATTDVFTLPTGIRGWRATTPWRLDGGLVLLAPYEDEEVVVAAGPAGELVVVSGHPDDQVVAAADGSLWVLDPTGARPLVGPDWRPLPPDGG